MSGNLKIKVEGLDNLRKDIPNMNKKELTFLYEIIGIMRSKSIGGFDKPISLQEEKKVMDKARLILIAITDRLKEIENNPGLLQEIEKRKAKRKREKAKKRKEYRKKLNPFFIFIMNMIRKNDESDKLLLENIQIEFDKKLVEFPEEDQEIIHEILREGLQKELKTALGRLNIKS